MFSRVDTGTVVGAGMTGGGLTVEVAKKAIESAERNIPHPSQDIMQLDWLFFTPDYHLNTGGAIALIGSIILIHSSYRGYKEKQRRREKEALNSEDGK